MKTLIYRRPEDFRHLHQAEFMADMLRRDGYTISVQDMHRAWEAWADRTGRKFNDETAGADTQSILSCIADDIEITDGGRITFFYPYDPRRKAHGLEIVALILAAGYVITLPDAIGAWEAWSETMSQAWMHPSRDCEAVLRCISPFVQEGPAL